MDEPPLLVLDACCAINLLASGVIGDVLAALACRPVVTELVLEREVLRLPAEGSSDPQDEAAAADRLLSLGPLVEEGLLGLVGPASDAEVATFVDLALRLDDGEAMSAAIAIHRDGVLATDDRKAIRVVAELAPKLEVRRTSHLLREWAESTATSRATLREILRRVERDASFSPPLTDPNVQWWRDRRG